jgi:dihydrofolate reductase
MSKVFCNIALSLDGFMAPKGMTMAHFHDPGYLDWGAKWGALMTWALDQCYVRETLKLGEGGETGPVNDMLRATFERTGAHIMGRRMFDGGELGWPDEAPFRTPVFVLTHSPRAPWERPGGTVFHFVTEGPLAALAQARAAAGERDIRISGGADVIQQYLNLGVVDEMEIALAPVLFGGGRRLFENLTEPLPGLSIDCVLHEPKATHLRYLRV